MLFVLVGWNWLCSPINAQAEWHPRESEAQGLGAIYSKMGVSVPVAWLHLHVSTCCIRFQVAALSHQIMTSFQVNLSMT